MGKDLTEAREAWAVEVDDLAAQCELEPEVVRAAEEGSGDVATFASLADALGGTFDDLVAQRRFWEAPTIAFRSTPRPLDRALVKAILVRLARAAAAHRSAVALVPDPEPPLRLDPVAVTDAPAAQAEELAKRVRELLDNPREPISSVRGVLRRFGFGTFLSAFGTGEIDGVSWRDAEGRGYGAANIEAREGSVTAVRMTFAHELSHLLFDGLRGEALGIVEQRRGETEAREQRANAFAAYLLAPRGAVLRFLRERGLPHGKPPNAQDVLALSAHFGMGVEAIGSHLVSCKLWERADIVFHRGLRTELRQGADTIEHDGPGAASTIALERRGEILDLATAALEEGTISVGRWRELVGLGLFDDCTRILAEREALGHVEHHSM